MTHRPAERIWVLREAKWFLWERPRLPKPLVRSKYPTTHPWSPAAAARHQEGLRDGLVFEHLEARVLLLADMLERADDWSPGTFAAELH